MDRIKAVKILFYDKFGQFNEVIIMDILSQLSSSHNIEKITLQKMILLYNALENGWEVKKKNDKYRFIKKHEGKEEIFHDSYLKCFVEENINLESVMNKEFNR